MLFCSTVHPSIYLSEGKKEILNGRTFINKVLINFTA